MANVKGCHDPWAKLANAILVAGRNDTYFQESEWAEDLREMCRLDEELHRRNTEPCNLFNNVKVKQLCGGSK